jgi:drug/metabolite transporter (DMT)-like permease
VPSSDTILEIVAAAGAAACFDGAVVLQATETQAVADEHGLRPSLLTRLVRRPRWVLGTLLAVLGWPLQLVAFALAPFTVVQPTLALGLVLLLILGRRILGEQVGRAAWGAAAIVVAGVVLLTLVAPERSDAIPDSGRLIGVLALLALAIALPFARGQARAGAWMLIASAGTAFAASALTGKLIVVELQHGRPLAALGLAGATVLAAGIGFLVDMTALQRFAATRVAPPMFVAETAIPVACAPFLLHESWSGTPGGGALVILGLLLVLVGGAGLGRSRTVNAIEHPGDPAVPSVAGVARVAGARPRTVDPAGGIDQAAAPARDAASSSTRSAADGRAP